MRRLRAAAPALLLLGLGFGLGALALDSRVALRPGGLGSRLLRGVAPKGVVAERAGLLLPGFDRRRTAELRLALEPASGRPTDLELRVDGEVETRVALGARRELHVPLKAAAVDALRLELLAIGGPLRIVSLELAPGPALPSPAPALVALLALATWLLARRGARPAALELGLVAASLGTLLAGLPFGLAAWPASWRAVLPALLVLALSLVSGLRRGRRAFGKDVLLALAFAVGAAPRLVFAHSTGSWDTEYWKAWMHRSMEAGLTQAYGPAEALPPGHALAQYRGQEEAWKVEWRGRRFVVDYPPLSMALWAASGRLVDALAPGLPSFERDNVAVKLPALLGDLLALLVLPWAWRPRWRKGLVLALAYWALPVSWLSSGVLGYFDGILPPLMVAALVCAGTRRPLAAGALLAVAALIKPTAAIVAPAAAVALWRGGAGLARAAAAGLAVTGLVFLPYALDGTLVTALVHCARLFLQENLSGGYPNAWWLLGHGLTYREAHGLPGPVAFAPVALFPAARLVGTLLFVACAALVVRRQPAGPRAACLAGALLFLAYGMVGVGVHENHPHPLFLLLLAAGLPALRLRLLFAACAVVYLVDMLALSGIGRFHGPRYLWLAPLADAAGALRMALGVDLTLPATLLHMAAFAAALAWAADEERRVEAEAPLRDAERARRTSDPGPGGA